MTFKTRCPHCNCKLEVEDEWVGQECQCPQCQKSFVVSAPEEPAKPKPKPIPMIVPDSTTAKTSASAPGASAPAPSPSVPGPSAPPLPPPPKISFRPAPGVNRHFAAQPEQPKEKTLICPKCKKSYTVTQSGVYPCRCGTTLELLDNGAINVHMVIPKHGVGFYILLAVLVGLMLVTVAIVLIVLTAEG